MCKTDTQYILKEKEEVKEQRKKFTFTFSLICPRI